MRSNRLNQAICAVTGALALSVASLQGGEVKVVVTKVDDGDIKHVQDGIHEDGSLTLLHEGSISLAVAEPGCPVKIVVDRSQVFQTMYGDGAAMTDSSAWVLMN